MTVGRLNEENSESKLEQSGKKKKKEETTVKNISLRTKKLQLKKQIIIIEINSIVFKS